MEVTSAAQDPKSFVDRWREPVGAVRGGRPDLDALRGVERVQHDQDDRDVEERKDPAIVAIRSRAAPIALPPRALRTRRAGARGGGRRP